MAPSSSSMLVRLAPLALLAGLLPLATGRVHSIAALGTQHTPLLVSNEARRRFQHDGIVVLRGCAKQVPEALKRQGCPDTLEEHAGVRSECRFAAGLACALLGSDAVRDPVGEWGSCCTYACARGQRSNAAPQHVRAAHVARVCIPACRRRALCLRLNP